MGKMAAIARFSLIFVGDTPEKMAGGGAIEGNVGRSGRGGPLDQAGWGNSPASAEGGSRARSRVSSSWSIRKGLKSTRFTPA